MGGVHREITKWKLLYCRNQGNVRGSERDPIHPAFDEAISTVRR